MLNNYIYWCSYRQFLEWNWRISWLWLTLNFQSWDILKMFYVTLPPFKICKDSGLNLLENAHSSSPVEDPAGSVLDATKKGPDPNKRSNQLSVEMLNKRSKADFTVGIIYNFYRYFGRHGLPSSARVLHTMRLYHDYLQDYHDYRDYLNHYPPRPALGTTTTATTTTTVTTMATETSRTTETTTTCVQYDYQHYQHYQRYPRLSALFKTTTAISATVTISSSSIVVAATSPSDVKIVTIVTTHCASLSWQSATCDPCCYLNYISLGEGKYLSRDTSNLK